MTLVTPGFLAAPLNVRIEARNVFIGHGNLIDRRSWLEKCSQGGGVLLDLQVYLSNLSHAFFGLNG